MCQECSLLSAWEAEYVWEDDNFLGGIDGNQRHSSEAEEPQVVPRQVVGVKLGKSKAWK